jgi:hypothetical protein
MSELILNLLVITGVMMASGAIFILIQQKRKREKREIDALAEQNGWLVERIHEPLAKGFRLIGPGWVLETVIRSSGQEAGPGSTNMEKKTTWFSNIPCQPLLVGPRTTSLDLGPFAEQLMKKIIRAALGREADGVREISIGDTAFQKKYLVLARDKDEADKVLTPAIQTALSAWQKVLPVIIRTNEGTRIELKDFQLRKADEITALVQLGEMFL